MRKSVLFVNPAYHYSFTLRDALRKLGWRADVYKNSGYPRPLLYADDVLTEGIAAGGPKFRFWHALRRAGFFLSLLFRYKHFFVYGDAEILSFDRVSRRVSRILGRAFAVDLFILNLFGKKILFFPNGCRQELLKRDFEKHENGNLCRNCTFYNSVCDDRENQRIFDLVNRYHNFVIANTPMRSPSLPTKQLVRHLSVDLDIFRPGIEVPEDLRLPPTGNVRILHSFYDAGRTGAQKNVKGSQYVLAAIDRLKREGHPVEYFYVNNVPARQMRYFQVQADIVVEQLIYGWWGSTGVECMALGKPVVCYLSEQLKRDFLKAFPEYDALPIVEAGPDSIYDVLKTLVNDSELRLRKGRKSREFAQRHFDISKNAPLMADLMLGL